MSDLGSSDVGKAGVRLVDLAHGGGCGCKIAPSVLQGILAASPVKLLYPNLLVGVETSDDAAVYQLNPDQAIVATTDFFTPIVDDPYEFGRIAATNALSDIYAMGGRPLFALAILGMPIAKLPLDAIQRIVAGGAAVCASAGIPVAGGHSIDAAEPIYGLAAIGLIHPAKLKRNSAARRNDVAILTKPLGVGIFSAAFRRNLLTPESYRHMIASTTQLNDAGAELSELSGMRAMTDVTGFGLLGHALEMCRGASLGLSVEFAALPIFPAAEALAKSGVKTGASQRNWDSYGQSVRFAGEPWRRDILTDPQTSGGLLLACDEAAAPAALELLRSRGFDRACAIGRFDLDEPIVHVSS